MSDYVVRPHQVLSQGTVESSSTIHEHCFRVLQRYETENAELRASLFCEGCALVVEVSATSSPYELLSI